MSDFNDKDFEQRLIKNELVKRIVKEFCDSFIQYINEVRDVRENTFSFTCYFNVTCSKVYLFHNALGFEKEFGWFNFSMNRYPNLSLEESKVMAQVLSNESVDLLKKLANSKLIHNDTNVKITPINHKVKKSKSSDFSVVSGVKYSCKNGCYKDILSW